MPVDNIWEQKSYPSRQVLHVIWLVWFYIHGQIFAIFELPRNSQSSKLLWRNGSDTNFAEGRATRIYYDHFWKINSEVCARYSRDIRNFPQFWRSTEFPVSPGQYRAVYGTGILYSLGRRNDHDFTQELRYRHIPVVAHARTLYRCQ